ncbi:MAG: hypothetical protein SAL70_31355 [Scytonema sp. PMC 1070.18]|nr:hypothetical protein [Scytonema sp. PMC 1070.18]
MELDAIGIETRFLVAAKVETGFLVAAKVETGFPVAAKVETGFLVACINLSRIVLEVDAIVNAALVGNTGNDVKHMHKIKQNAISK